MAKRINGGSWKIIAAALTALVLAGVVWIWDAAGYCDDVEDNTEAIAATVAEINDEVMPKIDSNSTAIFGIQKKVVGFQKDIERLNEKVDELNTSQRAMIIEQRAAFKEVMGRLPK